MKTVVLNEMKLIGIRVVCPGDQYVYEIPKASHALKERLNEIRNVVSPARVVGAFIAGDFTEEEDGYWVCVEVNEVRDVPKGMVSLLVPKQKYAVITHTGTKHEIRNTYELLHKWIKDNGFERIRRSWHLEIAEEWGKKDVGEEHIDLYDTIK